MKRLVLVFIISFTICKQSNGQVVIDTGDVFVEISSIISTMPGHSGNDYMAPGTAQLNTWGYVLKNLIMGDYANASDSANTIGYDLIQFLDTTLTNSTTYYILKTNSSNYWGTYVYNPNYCRPLVIQSPHPILDINTGIEGIHVFKRTEALFFCLSGTNRCNNSTYSTCDGTTLMCSSSSESYRISDLPHNLSTVFQSTTDSLFRNYDNTHFIQLHGFTKLSTDPYVILSNGTQITPSPDHMSTFKMELYEEDTSLTFKVAHVDLTWTRLRGFYNVQSRLVNSSSDYCNSNATTTNGRFFHFEQEQSKLRDDETGWDKVANALINTFTCPVLSNGADILNEKLTISPNPTNDRITLDINCYNGPVKVEVYNLSGRLLETTNSTTLSLRAYAKGIYVFKVSYADRVKEIKVVKE